MMSPFTIGFKVATLSILSVLSTCGFTKNPYMLSPWSGPLPTNQRWTSGDGRISLEMEGASVFGYGTFLINGEEKRVAMHFPLYRYSQRYHSAPPIGVYDGKNILLLVTATYHSDPQEFISFQTYADSNQTGDSYYDDWLATLTRESIPDEELDAKNFIVGGFRNEEEGFDLEYYSSNWLALEDSVSKSALEERNGSKTRSAYRGFIRDSLFTNELFGEKNGTDFIFQFQEDNAFYLSVKDQQPAKGHYVTNPDGMTLTFDEDALFGYAGKSVALKAYEVQPYIYY